MNHLRQVDSVDSAAPMRTFGRSGRDRLRFGKGRRTQIDLGHASLYRLRAYWKPFV